MKNLTVLALATLLFLGCCAKPEVIVRVDTLRVPYTDDYVGTLVLTDTVWQAGNDRVTVKVDTLFKKVWVKVRDTITVVHPDTVQVTVHRDILPTEWWVFWNSKKYWIVSFAIGLILAGAGLFIILKKMRI
jgi:hypothetical protein